MGLGFFATRAFKLPVWVTPALAFNNTTSLPLLLMESLDATGILRSILMSKTDTSSAAIDRAKSYFLVNSMVSNSLTFALGPRLLRPHEEDAPHNPQGTEAKGSNLQHEEDVENGSTPVPEPQSGEDRLDGNHAGQVHGGGDDAQEGQEQTHEEGMQEFINEETSLLPKAVVKSGNRAEREGYKEGKLWWDEMPEWAQSTLSLFYAFLNAPLFGAVIGAIIGLVPALHRLFFNETYEGGYLKAWLTASVENIGGLFAALQIIVVGVKLSQSLRNMKRGEDSGSVPWRSMVFITSIRFILWPL